MPYIGNQHNVGDHINNFKVLDDISSYTETFDGSATSVVSTTAETIRIPEHRFIQGQRVTYNNGGGSNIGGLTSGTAYYVSFDSANTVKLATSLANANSNTVINLSTVGGGTSHTLNAAFDGVNTKFKLTFGSGNSARLNNATQINVAINNVIQRPNLDPNNFVDGFALADNHKIVFKVAPTVNDIFWGSIIANTIENFDLRDNEVDNFTGNGSTTEFTLSTIPANNESVIVSINGVVQHPSDKDTARAYTLIDSIIQFTAAPGVGDEIQVRHIGFAGASTNDVSGFYGRTGNVVLTSNDHITTGNINAGVVTATSFVGNLTGNVSGNLTVGGVLTYEDVTNVDSIGIITARSGFKVLAGGANVVGVITARTNIHLEDYIHHLGDLTTKIGFPAANSVTVEAGGTGRVRIINGQTKIGPDADSATTSTNYEFQISGYSTGNCFALSLKHGTSGVGNNLRQAFFFKNDGGTAVDLARFQATCTANGAGSESGDLAFYTTNAGTSGERLHITSGGNIGIGSAIPLAKLETYQSGTTGYLFRAMAGLSVGNRPYDLKPPSSDSMTEPFSWNTGNSHAFQVDGVEYLRIADNGRVGIGTDNPTSLLTLGASAFPTLEFKDYTNNARALITGSTGGQLVFQTDYGNVNGNSDFIFRADSITNEIVRFKDTGEVGIGTDNPAQELSIWNDSPAIRLVDTNPYEAGAYGQISQSGSVLQFMADSGNTSGHGGIFFYSYNDNDSFNTYRISDNVHQWYISGEEKARLHSNGSLGIGTITPQSMLDVRGNTEVRDVRGNQNFFVSESGFRYSHSVSTWTNMDYTSSPVIAWDFKSGPGDLFYIGSGGNTPIADQMALVVSDTHGVKVGRSGYDGTDFDVSSTAEYFRITPGGLLGIGNGGTYTPETPLDVTFNHQTQAMDITTASNNNYQGDTLGDITCARRHSATKHSTFGYSASMIDIRATNASQEWSVGQILGHVDPLGGAGYMGGLSILVNRGGSQNPTGRRTQGEYPQVAAFFTSKRILTFSNESAQGTNVMHLSKNSAAANVQSDMIAFDVGGGGRGKIVSASSGSGTPSFGAYSDRRLKTNFRDYTGGYDRIKSIPVKLYDEVLDDQTKSVIIEAKKDVIGWIADEVQSVFPEAVMGTKDEVDSDGKPVYQSLTEGIFLPDAIQAIQKLIQKVETLEAEVAALKSS